MVDSSREGFEKWANGWLELNSDPIIAQVASSAWQASRSAAIEECAAIANEWAQSMSCISHENDPCCHVRTGAEIRDRIELLARLKGEG